MKRWGIVVAAWLLLSGSFPVGSDAGNQVEMISVAALRQELASPGLKILDVRDPQSWESSSEKIPGAVREEPNSVPMWQSKYEKSDRIVLYCA